MESFPRRILVLKPSSLGDVVHTLPAVAALKSHWSSSEITWLINPEWASLLEGNSDVTRIKIFPRRELGGLLGWTRFPKWLGTLETPDLAVDFQGLLRTALIARCVGSKKIHGLSDAREGAGFFYHQTTRLPLQSQHAVDRYLQLARDITGTPVEKPVFPLPAGTPPSESIGTPFILLHPFSRGTGKSLTAADVSQLCRDLQPYRVILVGGKSTVTDLPENVTNLLGKTTLAELIWLIRHAEFTVSVDSGPMHIAAAITSRLLSIHTWSDPQLVGPYNADASIWKNGAIVQMRRYDSNSTEKNTPPNVSQIAAFVRDQLSSARTP